MSLYNDLDAAVDELLSNAEPGMIQTQLQFVLWMELTRSMSWDIPSALGFLCTHWAADDCPWQLDRFGEFPMHREVQSYWDGQNPWPLIDTHFKEVHGFDLTDDHIDWSFDT